MPYIRALEVATFYTMFQLQGPVDDREAVLVGRVVADENREPARERRFRHERLDRGALVAPAGLDLEHELADLHLETRADPRQGAGLPKTPKPLGLLFNLIMVEKLAKAHSQVSDSAMEDWC